MLNVNRLGRGVSAVAIGALMIMSGPAVAAENPKVSAEIMALARAQWASEIANEPMVQQNASLAEDYTEFNGDFPTLVVGKTMSTRMGEVTPYDKAMYSDMQNGRVQTYGDTLSSPIISRAFVAAPMARSFRRERSRPGYMLRKAVSGCWCTPISRPSRPAIKFSSRGAAPHRRGPFHLPKF